MTDGLALDPELVSIVVPAYNARKFLEETIRSVQAQSWRNWELLIVDDRSTDGTPALVQGLASVDARIRLLLQSKNQGPGAARDAGLAMARGRYVAFLDSDDLWLPEKLERQVEALRVTDAALCYTAVRRISADGYRVGRLISVPLAIDYRGLLKNTVIVTSTVMIDRGRTGVIRSRRTFHDDFVLWLEILKQGAGAVGLPLDLVRYRVVGQSYSRSKLQMAWHVWRTYRDIEHLDPVTSIWCLGHYSWNAFWKYRQF